MQNPLQGLYIPSASEMPFSQKMLQHKRKVWTTILPPQAGFFNILFFHTSNTEYKECNFGILIRKLWISKCLRCFFLLVLNRVKAAECSRFPQTTVPFYIDSTEIQVTVIYWLLWFVLFLYSGMIGPWVYFLASPSSFICQNKKTRGALEHTLAQEPHEESWK